MYTLLDIGNTRTRIAIADGGPIEVVKILPTTDLTVAALAGYAPIFAACVVPVAKAKLQGLPITYLTAQNAGSLIDFTQVDTSTLGADRVANCLAALDDLLPSMVIDCGTAITLEVIDVNKVFRGGAILPGRQLMRQALHDHTGALPLIALSPGLPPVGVDTASSIAFGIDAGIAGMVRELIRRTETEFGCRFTLLGAGGDIDFLRQSMPEIQKTPIDFTLRGLLKFAQTFAG